MNNAAKHAGSIRIRLAQIMCTDRSGKNGTFCSEYRGIVFA